MSAAQAIAAAATEGLTLERANSASGFRFVQTLRDSYRVQLFHNSEVHSLGSFPTPEEAALCVARWLRDHPATDEEAGEYVRSVSVQEAASDPNHTTHAAPKKPAERRAEASISAAPTRASARVASMQDTPSYVDLVRAPAVAVGRARRGGEGGRRLARARLVLGRVCAIHGGLWSLPLALSTWCRAAPSANSL